MDGDALLKEMRKRLSKQTNSEKLTDAAFCRELGISLAGLALLRGKELSPKQVVNLMEKFGKRAEARLMQATVVPIVEFFQIDSAVRTKHDANWCLFSAIDSEGKTRPYLEGLKSRLETKHGIYVFHDSRGRAIYAGKAQRQSLWKEMNNAYNRDRGEVQSIKRAYHPKKNVQYKGLEIKKRQIRRESIALYDVAFYLSAYEVPDGLIGKFEALLVRAFANDLLNVRMENF